MHQRIRLLRKSMGLSQKEFAERLGLTQTSLSLIENGINVLTNKNIKFICSIFCVDENWLRTGEGEMFFSSPYEKEFLDIFGSLCPAMQQHLLLMTRNLLVTQQKLSDSGEELEDV